MIAKNIKGKSFGGCVRYVMNEGCELLEAEGVFADTAESIIRSFAMQKSCRSEVLQPVGHIPLSFSPKDSPRMKNKFMLQLAHEYMQEMGIENTQYIVVRHHNTDHEHLHVVYNRIDNDLKLISVNNDYKRNIEVCKKLKDRHKLTYGKGKEEVKRDKLHGADKIKYEIYDTIKTVLPLCKSSEDLQTLLRQSGIETKFKLRRTTGEIEGVSFCKGKIAFKGSQIDRKFSYENLLKEFEKNISAQENNIEQEKQSIKSPDAKRKTLPKIGGVELSDSQFQTLKDGKIIYLEGMTTREGKRKTGYVFTDDQNKRVFVTTESPDIFVRYGKYEMRLMDKLRIEAGFITRAKVKWFGGVDFAHPYLWNESKDDADYKESWSDPRKPEIENKSKESSKTVTLRKKHGVKR